MYIHILTFTEANETKIYAGILLGDNYAIDRQTRDIYNLAGISHILSISGLHISLIGYTLYKIVRKRLLMPMASGCSILFVWMYLMMTGNGISTRRAVLMFVIGLLALLVGRTYDMISSLSAAVSVLILNNPYCVFHTGFQLSCGAIAGIILYQQMQDWMSIKSKILRSVSVSMCVTMVTMPIIIHMNHEISIYAVLLNVVIVATVPGMMIAGLVAVALSFCFVAPARMVFYIGCLFLRAYKTISIFVLRLPYSVKIAAGLRGGKLIGYELLLVIVGIIIHNMTTSEELEKSIAYKRRILFVFMYLFFVTLLTKPVENQATVKMIDVGQGDSIFIRSYGFTCLIDAGSSSEKQVGEYTILPFLKANGVEKLDYLIVTHGDADHCNGMEYLLSYRYGKMPYVRHLIVYQNAVESEELKKVIDTAENNHVKVVRIHAGYYLSDGEIKLECIWPLEEDFHMDINNLSLVFQMSNRDGSMIFTGDIEKEAEEKMVQLYGDRLRADWLKSPHHGSKTSSTKEFLDCVNPSHTLISVGEHNRYSHPSSQTIEEYEQREIQIYRTDLCGEIMIDLSGKRIRTYK